MNKLDFAKLRLAALGVCLLVLGACQKAPAPAADEKGATHAAASAAENKAANAGVTLNAEQLEKMGIVTSAAKAASYTPAATGYAIVLAHEGIAQSMAELVSAQAVAQQSRAALARIQHLAGTAGAMPADAQESAARQSAVDEAAAALARQRLSGAFGQNPPWRAGDTALLSALADGRSKLVRATFPLGQLNGGAPKGIELAPVDAAQSDKRWTASAFWSAPSDANVPGRSYFVILTGTEASEGERLLATAPSGTPVAGVLVPDSAAVISDGKYWCYVERKPGVFERVQIDAQHPLAVGYFMHDTIHEGDQIVTAAAGQLLAREMNSGAAAD